jgi:hypothetical protein
MFQGNRERREQELSERAGGRPGPERKRTPLFGQQFAERRQHDIE